MIRNLRVVACVLAVGACRPATAHTPPGFQGVLELDEREVTSELGGRVQSVFVRRGETVTANASVATLDDSLARPMRAARAADLEAARARLSLLRAGARPSEFRSLEAQIAGARAVETSLERNTRRARSLAEQGAAPAAQSDDLNDQLSRARAERNALEERLRTMRSGARTQEIAAAEAQVAATEQALAVEDQRLSRHALRAPIAGTVIDVLRDPGDVVAPGAAVAILADKTHPYVDVFVPQARMRAVRVGTAATVRVDALPQTLRGAVEDVGREVEFTPRFLFSEQERPSLVLRVRVRIEDPDARLYAGVPTFVTLDGVAP